MRTIKIPAREESLRVQSIISLSVSYINRTVTVIHALGDMVGGEFVPEVGTEIHESIDFDQLMSEGPDWAPGKPAGSFRKEDVLEALDRTKARKKREHQEALDNLRTEKDDDAAFRAKRAAQRAKNRQEMVARSKADLQGNREAALIKKPAKE